MKLIDVRCNGCGAPLQMTEGTRFVTCKFCRTQLAVEQTDSPVHTEVSEKGPPPTIEESLGELRSSRLENELARLDREYQATRESLELLPRCGRRGDPYNTGPILLLVVGAPLMLAAVLGVFRLGTPWFYPILGLGGLAVLVFLGKWIYGNAAKLGEAEISYKKRRSELLKELEETRL